MIEDEIDTLNPDIVIVHFGGNDVGLYNYNANVPETEEVLNKRKTSLDNYFLNMRKLVKLLKDRGLEVYIMTPFAENENIVEKDDIETVKDNVDKAKYLKSDFYCKASFRKINNMWKEIAIPELYKIAEENSVQVIDAFSYVYEQMLKSNNMYTEDGIHLSRGGHEVVARFLLNYLGYENIPESFDIKSDLCNIINQLEQTERHIQFFRRWIFYPLEHKPFADVNTEEDVKRKLKELMQDPKYPFFAFAEVADYFYDSMPVLREKCVKLIKKL
jgi:lysophospholipase L1-like esterase